GDFTHAFVFVPDGRRHGKRPGIQCLWCRYHLLVSRRVFTCRGYGEVESTYTCGTHDHSCNRYHVRDDHARLHDCDGTAFNVRIEYRSSYDYDTDWSCDHQGSTFPVQ